MNSIGLFFLHISVMISFISVVLRMDCMNQRDKWKNILQDNDIIQAREDVDRWDIKWSASEYIFKVGLTGLLKDRNGL